MIERAHFIGTAICTAPIREEIGNQAVITFYHQFNDNILDLLESAKDEYSMKTMVEMRLNPNYYQQKTAAPKAGAVAMAAKELGQFERPASQPLMQLETDPRFSNTIKIGHDSPSSPRTRNRYLRWFADQGSNEFHTKGSGRIRISGGREERRTS